MTLVVLGLALATHTAYAGTSTRLVFGRSADAASCGDESALRHAVARRLGYDPFVAVSESSVVAEIRGDGPGLRARMFVIEHGNTVGGARELTSKSKDCSELRLAVALAISIAIDPDALDRVVEDRPDEAPNGAPKGNATPKDSTPEAPPAPKSPNPSPAPAPSVKAVEPSPVPQGPQAHPVTWRLGLGGFAATGPTPFPTLGPTGALSVGWFPFSAGLEARWALPVATSPTSPDGWRASVSMVGATIAPCYHVQAWSGCYLLDLARLDSLGLVTVPRRDVSLWMANGLRISYRVGGAQGFGATAKLDALLATGRVSLFLDGQLVHRTPLALGRLSLEADYSF